MDTGRRGFPFSPARLAGLLAVTVLLLPACGDSGPHSLSDTQYWRVRFSKGEGIETVVKQGQAAVPLLITLLEDDSEWVVQNAATAAQQIGRPAAATVPALLGALARFKDQPFVVAAIKEMQEAAVPHLVPLLESRDADEQARAVKALNGIGPEAEPAIEPLLEIAEDESADLELRRAALVTLGSIGMPAVPMLDRINKLASSNEQLRNDAAMAHKRIRTAKKVRDKGGNQ